MSEPANAETVGQTMDAMFDMIALIAFIHGEEKHTDAIVRAFTDMAADTRKPKLTRDIIRQVAMQIHDLRVRNKGWKKAQLEAGPD